MNTRLQELIDNELDLVEWERGHGDGFYEDPARFDKGLRDSVASLDDEFADTKLTDPKPVDFDDIPF